MNNRIKELLVQASSTHYSHTTVNGSDVYKTIVDQEAFATSIINDCIEIIATCKWPSWAEACDSREVFVEAIVTQFGITHE
jgi:hypothetical protein